MSAEPVQLEWSSFHPPSAPRAFAAPPHLDSREDWLLNPRQITVDAALHLRPVALSDAEELFAVADANRAHLRPWMMWIDQTRSVAGTARFIEFAQDEAAGGRGLHCAMVEQGRIVGVCAFCRIEPGNRRANIGYWLDASAGGRGIVSRSVTALSLYGFAKLGLNRLVIACATGNHASAAVAERCGFRFEGIAREAEWLHDRYVDHRIHARLRSDLWFGMPSAPPA